MTTTTQPATSASPAAADPRRRDWARTACLVALGGIAIRAIDDAFLQTSGAPVDHVPSGTVPLMLCGIVAVTICRSSGGLRTFATLCAAAWGVVGSAELFIERGPRHGGFEADDVSGVLSLVAGAVLLVCTVHHACTSRSRAIGRLGRAAHRTATALTAVVVSIVTVFPLGLAYVATHFVGAGLAEAPDLDAPVERVEFEASDGLDLSAWYAAPGNGAVVIVVSGRSGVDHARMLVANGYGVLLLNRRGEADSEGEPNLYGWEGDRDILGAVAYLQTRPEVDEESIAALGLSVGGEFAVQTASESSGLSAVISDGAGSRSIKESLELSGGIKWAELSIAPVLTAGLVVLTDQAPPPNLMDLSAELSTPTLFIWGGEGQPAEIMLGRRYAEAAGDSAEVWEVPGAAHIGGIDTAPEDYERHVVDFLDRHLLGPSDGARP